MPDNPPTDSISPLPYRPMLRSKPTLGRRLTTSLRAWSRTTFSRESMLSSFYTFLWVVPLTILIWIYAEREELVPSPNYDFKIEARQEPTQIITFDGQTELTTVRADLLGPRGKLETVKQRLDSSQNPLQIEFGPHLEPGRQRVSIRKLINDPLFVANGVAVSKLVPEEVTINVDPIITKDDVEVSVKPNIGSQLDKVSFDRKVRVSAPQSYFAQNPNFAVYAELPNVNKPQTVTETVPLVPSAPGPHVSIEPSTVVATFTVKEVSQTKIDSMPVYVTIPQDFKFGVEPAQKSILNVIVTGPKEALDKLDPSKLYATIDIMSAGGGDFKDPATNPEASYIGQLHYEGLSEGLHVNSDAPRIMGFKLKPKSGE